MNAKHIGAAAVVTGLLLLVTSFIWPALDNPRSEWTDEDAEAHQDLVKRVHAGHYATADARRRANVHGGDPPDGAALVEHRENVRQLDELNTKLNEAREGPRRIANILKWSGAGVLAVGVIVLLASRGKTA